MVQLKSRHIYFPMQNFVKLYYQLLIAIEGQIRAKSSQTNNNCYKVTIITKKTNDNQFFTLNHLHD